MAKLILAMALMATSASPPAAGIGPSGLEPSSSADRLLSRLPASPPTSPAATRTEDPLPEDAGTPSTLSWSPPAPSTMGDSAAALLSPATIGTRPASSEKPRTARTLRGSASWYGVPGRVGAADLKLRRFLGRGWRGENVVVCAWGPSSKACVAVRLVTTCGCPGNRIIDLSPSAFAVLAPLSKGTVHVSVARSPGVPATDTVR